MSKLLRPWPQLAEAGDAPVELDQLRVSLRRGNGECWLDYRYLDADESGERELTPPQSRRFLLGSDAGPVQVRPLLADRAVVGRPLAPTELLPRERVTLLVSTALWVRVSAGDHGLAELPCRLLSDTWFGRDTRHGELCYASHTSARLHQDNLPRNPFRAITPVTVINRGSNNLKLERINVPVPHLTLYCDGEHFWTAALTVAREGDLAPTKVEIEERAPLLSSGAEEVAPPRRPVRGGVLDRAVELLFA